MSNLPGLESAQHGPLVQAQSFSAWEIRMVAALQREAVQLGTAHKPALLEAVPNAAGIVVLAPQLRLLRRIRHRQQLLGAMHERRLATLDLDTPEQLEPALRWSAQQSSSGSVPLGLWFDREAAPLALEMAAMEPARVRALVLVNPKWRAGAALAQVHAATLLMQLGGTPSQLALQQRALARLSCNKRLEHVPLPAADDGAGAVEAVAQIGSAWMATHLANRRML